MGTEKAEAEIQKEKAVKEAESASKKAIPFVEKMKDFWSGESGLFGARDERT